MSRLRARLAGAVALMLCSLSALASAVAAPPARYPELFDSGRLLELVFSLLLVVLALFFFLWFLRRLQAVPTGNGAIRVLAVHALSARDKLVLIEVGDERLLLGTAPGATSLLHVLAPDNQVVARPVARPGVADGFPAVINRLLGRTS